MDIVDRGDGLAQWLRARCAERGARLLVFWVTLVDLRDVHPGLSGALSFHLSVSLANPAGLVAIGHVVALSLGSPTLVDLEHHRVAVARLLLHAGVHGDRSPAT